MPSTIIYKHQNTWGDEKDEVQEKELNRSSC
jgi:hypothetical protein